MQVCVDANYLFISMNTIFIEYIGLGDWSVKALLYFHFPHFLLKSKYVYFALIKANLYILISFLEDPWNKVNTVFGAQRRPAQV